MAAPAMADTEVNETLDAAADGNVEVSNTAGSIEIRGWAENKVEVRGTLGDDVEELIFERDGDDVLIKVKVPRHHGRDIDGELTIKVPQASSIEVSGVSADIDVDGVLGEQSLQTVSGNVGIQSASADVEAASVSGDVDVAGTGKDADIEAATVSGDVTLSGLAGSVEAGSVSGDVLIGDGSFDNAELETVNGDLRFMAELRPDGELAMESVNGSVEVEFAGDVSARFDIETFNGSIKNCFGPKPERTSKYSPGLELSFTHGDGDGYVAIETLNGSVSICNK
jgi:DUF4097 and DUF4098 domain-containing protein YvlB